tara:strand:+ start:541 stop:1947 length:1407 start_codon:yes stop_codon:yes gene_type:complete
MTEPEIIDIGVSKISDSPVMGPKLSVISDNDSGTIKLNNLPSLSSPPPSRSVNFGPGAEMLMNAGKASRANSPKSDIQLSELKSLESDEPPRRQAKAVRAEVFSSMPSSDTIKLNISEPINTPPQPLNTDASNLGNSTAQDVKKEETWDGFQKFNEIPVDPVKEVPETPKLTPEQELKEKFIYIRKLEALDRKGVSISKKYTMDDKLDEMKGEYEMIKSEQQKKNSIKFQGKMLMAFVSGIEFLNGKFDPFDIKLDGWGEAVSENLDEYDDVFAELHEKYGGKAKMAPELKLLFMLGGSAGMIHMTNTMFKSAMPGMDDIMRQNPELMQQFTQAAVNTMGQQNPGFGNFMQNMMPPRGSPPGPPMHMNQPPNRPDLNMARGRANFNDAVNMEDQYSNVSKQKSSRREMKGPSDINDILAGVKTKKVNIKNSDNSSTISVSELEEMKGSLPKKSKRKPRSSRNTVSLNL